MTVFCASLSHSTLLSRTWFVIGISKRKSMTSHILPVECEA